VYNYIGLGLHFEILGNGIRRNETKHVELEQFLHAFMSRGFDSVSWAFLFIMLYRAMLHRCHSKSFVHLFTEVITACLSGHSQDTRIYSSAERIFEISNRIVTSVFDLIRNWYNYWKFSSPNYYLFNRMTPFFHLSNHA